jgi:hypothetical protein
MLVLLVVGIYEDCHWDGPKCHDIHTKFNKNWLRHSKVVMGGYRNTDCKVTSLLQNKESRLQWLDPDLALMAFYTFTITLMTK